MGSREHESKAGFARHDSSPAIQNNGTRHTADLQADIPRSKLDTLLAERIYDKCTRTDVSTHCANWSHQLEVDKDTTHLGAIYG